MDLSAPTPTPGHPQIPTLEGTKSLPTHHKFSWWRGADHQYIFILHNCLPSPQENMEIFETTTILALSAGLRLVFSKPNLLVVCLSRSCRITERILRCFYIMVTMLPLPQIPTFGEVLSLFIVSVQPHPIFLYYKTMCPPSDSYIWGS